MKAILIALLLYGSLLTGSSLTQAISVALLLPAVAWTMIRDFPLLNDTVVLSIPLFCILAIPAITAPIVGEYGSQKSTDLFTLTLFTALTASLISKQADLRVFIQIWVVFGCALAAICLVGGYGAGGIAGRAVGLGSNPIGLARPIGSAILATLWLSFHGQIRPARAWATTALLTLGLFATGSKGPALAAALGSLVLVGATQGRSRRLLQLTLGIALAYVAIVVSPLASTRLGQFIADPFQTSDPVRARAIDVSWYLLSHGAPPSGYGGWRSAVGAPPGLNYPHNIWLELAVEGGKTVAIAFLIVVVLVLARCISVARTSPIQSICAAWIVYEALTASLSGDIRARSFFFFLALGYAAATSFKRERNSQADAKCAGLTAPGSMRSMSRFHLSASEPTWQGTKGAHPKRGCS